MCPTETEAARRERRVRGFLDVLTEIATEAGTAAAKAELANLQAVVRPGTIVRVGSPEHIAWQQAERLRNAVDYAGRHSPSTYTRRAQALMGAYFRAVGSPVAATMVQSDSPGVIAIAALLASFDELP